MVFKLPIVKAKEYSFVSTYSITSLILMALTIYLYIADPTSWPNFMKNWPSLLINILFACLFLNGCFALLRPSLAKPELFIFYNKGHRSRRQWLFRNFRG